MHLPLRLESFDDDTENIVTSILGVSAGERLWDRRGKLTSKLGFPTAGALLALAAMAIGALVHFWILNRALSTSIATSQTTLLLILGAMLGAWIGYRYDTWMRRSR
jgi:hypothetical protein